MRYFHRLPLRVIVTIAVTLATSSVASAEVQGRKWHPGHYVRPSIAQGFASEWLDSDSLQGRKSIYDLLKEEPRFAGGSISVPWALIETDEGVYDFSQIDADLAYVRALGKHLIIELTMEWWHAEGYIPQYVIDKGGVVDSNNGADPSADHFYRTNFDLPWVMDRFVALHVALAEQYDEDPNVELITFGETAAVGCSQWASGVQRIGPLWSHTNVVLPMNFCDVAPGPLLATAVASGVGVGGPDTRTPEMGEDHGSRALRGVGMDVQFKQPDAGAVVDFGTHDYRGEIPVAYEYEGLGDVPPAQLIDYILNTLKSTHQMWATRTGPYCGAKKELCYEDGIWPTLDAVDFKISTACPTSYNGACNTAPTECTEDCDVEPETTAPIAHWRMDAIDIVDGEVLDVSGNGYNARIVGDPTAIAGMVDEALAFDGVDDFLDTSFVTTPPHWTVAVWTRGVSAPESDFDDGPVMKHNSFLISWDHRWDEARGGSALSVDGSWSAASFGTLEGGIWYHLAATYDGETLKTYVDGQLVHENSAPSGATNVSTSALTMVHNPVGTSFFAGAVDDVRIYDRAIAETELTTLARLGNITPRSNDGGSSEGSSEKQTSNDVSPTDVSAGCSAANSGSWVIILTLIGLAARRRRKS